MITVDEWEEDSLVLALESCLYIGIHYDMGRHEGRLLCRSKTLFLIFL